MTALEEKKNQKDFKILQISVFIFRSSRNDVNWNKFKHFMALYYGSKCAWVTYQGSWSNTCEFEVDFDLRIKDYQAMKWLILMSGRIFRGFTLLKYI